MTIENLSIYCIQRKVFRFTALKDCSIVAALLMHAFVLALANVVAVVPLIRSIFDNVFFMQFVT